jgi:UDP-glucuronate 4-epimerase
VRFLITGTAGFIGFHLARRLLASGHSVWGLDGMTPYYDVSLKQARHALLEAFDKYRGHVAMLEDEQSVRDIVAEARPEAIVHLAAQAGVRYSLENPRAYLNSNLVGGFNLMEAARTAEVGHFLLASTSSVYGGNAATPFREIDRADHPLTFYAATKKGFFTVYGPWGRPDMALFKFVKAMLADEPIDVYGDGAALRDFTYIDDLIEAIVRLVDRPPREGQPIAEIDSLSPVAPYRVVNIGGGRPVTVLELVEAIETHLRFRAKRRFLDAQKGDAPVTWAAPDLLEALTGYAPATSLEDGVAEFVDWHRGHYRV